MQIKGTFKTRDSKDSHTIAQKERTFVLRKIDFQIGFHQWWEQVD